MSITRIYSVFCDISGHMCIGWIAEEHSAAEARRYAREHGWKRTRGQDVCPACQEKK